MINERVIIFSDLDGTLLDHFTYKSTEALTTIEQLSVAKIPVILTTSKTLAEVLKIQANLTINAPLIVENGAAVFIPKNTFRTQPEDTTSNGEYWVKSFCLPRQHWLDVIASAPERFTGLYQGFSSLTVADLADLTGLTPDDAHLAKDREYGEPIHWLGNKSKEDQMLMLEFIQYLEEKGATILQGGRFMHVGGESDKGKALQWLSERYNNYYHVEKTLTIALGDGKNDIAMLDVADFAVQIKSPVHDFPKLNRTTNIIQTKQYGPAGWAEALQELLCEQLSNKHLSSHVQTLINS